MALCIYECKSFLLVVETASLHPFAFCTAYLQISIVWPAYLPNRTLFLATFLLLPVERTESWCLLYRVHCTHKIDELFINLIDLAVIFTQCHYIPFPIVAMI